MPEFREFQECPLCAQLVGERHLPDCPVIQDPPDWIPPARPYYSVVEKSRAVTVRYVRERPAGAVTDEMAERVWRATHAGREPYQAEIATMRAALDAALSGGKDA